MSKNNGSGYPQNIPGQANYQSLPSPQIHQQWPHNFIPPPPPHVQAQQQQQQQHHHQHHHHQQQQQRQQPVAVIPLMHHQISPLNAVPAAPATSSWNSQYYLPPSQHQQNQVIYHHPGPFPYGAQMHSRSDPLSYNTPLPFQYQQEHPPPTSSGEETAPSSISRQQQKGTETLVKTEQPQGFPVNGLQQSSSSSSWTSLTGNNNTNTNGTSAPTSNASSANTANTSSSNPNDNNNNTTFVRSQLPPYAIATMNSVHSKRQKTDLNSGKKGFRNSRRRHRNSHLGCATCKSRRIKCDEQLPECRNCIRARLRCAYLALDETARDALKVAQEAHAARIESLNIQANEQENKAQYYYPYNSEGLPTKILANPLPPYPPANVQPLQFNLQRPFFPLYQIPPQPVPVYGEHQLPPASSHAVTSTTQPLTTQRAQEQHQVSLSKTSGDTSPTASSTTDYRRPISESTAVSSTSPEPRFAIDSNSYVTLSALIKDHKDANRDLDDLARLDGEYVEIVLDPNCTRHLNKNWVAFNKKLLEPFETGFEKEFLYKEYDSYHIGQMREAKNNVVLFKSLISNGAALLLQFSENDEVREVASRQLNRDFEICLRFLNKFRIRFTQDVENIADFYENVTLCFSKFQVYQTAIPTTIYCSNTMKDNVEVTNRFFDFVISYLNDEFKVFLNQDVRKRYQGNEYFDRADLFNDYMHVFIVYYVQCIKSYHTAPYNTLFMVEFLKKFQSIKEIIYEKLSDEDKRDYDNLETFLTANVDYWSTVRETPSSTNRLQVIFYTLKKFLSILPGKSYIIRKDYSFESHLLEAFYNATTDALKSIYPEVRFFFVFSFNGRDGTRPSSFTSELLKGDRLNHDQKSYFEYPARITKFFKERTFLISQLLSDISAFPAKIVLDESNKQILMNLVKEEQIASFLTDVPKTAYPHIDETSNFYNKTTNSIVIPSVSATKSFSNFELSQTKRVEKLRKSVEDDLTELDQKLINSFFKENRENNQDYYSTGNFD